MKVTSDNEAAPQQGVGVLASFSLPLAISAAAILASFVFSILIFPAISTSLRLDVDPDNYGKLALNIYGGVGFVSPESSRPEIARGPLYPYFVAGIYSLAGGPRIETVQAVQAVCHGAMCFLIYLIGARFLGRRIAVAAQALCAIHPMLIWYTARVWIETVHTLLLVAAVLLLLKFVERRSAGWALGAGVTCGLVVLTKSALLLFPLISAAFLIFYGGHRTAWPVVLYVAVYAVTLAPWTVRNYLVTHEFVPVHVSAGFNLIQGDVIAGHLFEHPFSNLRLWDIGEHEAQELLRGTGLTKIDPAGDRVLASASLNYSATHPLYFMKRTAVNFLTFWYLSESKAKSIVLILLQLPLLICGAIAVPKWWRNEVHLRPLILVILYFVIVHSCIVGWARYSAPILPLCLILTAAVLCEWWGGRATTKGEVTLQKGNASVRRNS